MPTKHCERTGKVIFEDRRSAERALNNRKGKANGYGVAAYRCPYCGKFHIGHSRGTGRKRRSAERKKADFSLDTSVVF